MNNKSKIIATIVFSVLIAVSVAFLMVPNKILVIIGFAFISLVLGALTAIVLVKLIDKLINRKK